MSTVPISIIILGHEDTELLQKAVDSAKWAQEIILYWTSTKQPPQWLTNSLVRVCFTSIKQSDFAAFRNEAASLAKNEIVFFIDSDEVLTQDAEDQVIKLIAQDGWTGASVRRKDIFHGKQLRWGEVATVQILRIFKKGSFHFKRPVHEIAEVSGTTIDSKIVIQHVAHTDMSEFLKSILQYVQIEVGLRQKRKEHVSSISLFAWPIGKFIHNYFFKLGILDGWRGLIYALVMSLHSFSLRAMIYEQQQ